MEQFKLIVVANSPRRIGDSQTVYRQSWTVKKIIFFGIYRLFAKHVPQDIPLIGVFFHNLRKVLCRPLFKEVEGNFSIGKGVDFDNGCTIILREHSNIGDYALFNGSHATVTIGKHVMMGKFCIIICENHSYNEHGFSGYDGKSVLIDDYSWLGHRVMILPGVRIGKYAIIGAGSVVSKSIPDYAIAVGNPARIVKYRK